MKTALSTILAAVSALAYATAGLIAWDAALLLAISTTVGGYLGGRYSRRVRNTTMLRHLIGAVGAAMTVAFFVL